MAWSQLTRDIEVAVHWEDHSLHWFTHFTPATEKLGVRRQQYADDFRTMDLPGYNKRRQRTAR